MRRKCCEGPPVKRSEKEDCWAPELFKLALASFKLGGGGREKDVHSNRVNDNVLLGLSLAVIDLNTLEGSNDPLTLGNLVMGNEPARRLGQVVHADNDDNTEENLEGDRETPHQVLRAEVGTVIDPVGNHGTNGDNTTFNTDEQTTVLGVRALSLVGGDGGSVHAVADTSDNTAEDELQQRDLVGNGRDLDDDTDNHDNGTPDDHPTTTHPVTEEEGPDGTKETACRIY